MMKMNEENILNILIDDSLNPFSFSSLELKCLGIALGVSLAYIGCLNKNMICMLWHAGIFQNIFGNYQNKYSCEKS